MIKTAITFPFNLTFIQWSRAIVFDLNFLQIPLATNNNWWNWADSLYKANLKAFFDAPMPTKMVYPNEEDWSKWAKMFAHYCLTN